MNRHWFRWWWLLFLVPIAAGLARLRLDTEVLDLLPAQLPAVTGLKIYQEHFTRTRELVVTVKAPDADSAEMPRVPSPNPCAGKPISFPMSSGNGPGWSIPNRWPNSSATCG